MRSSIIWGKDNSKVQMKMEEEATAHQCGGLFFWCGVYALLNFSFGCLQRGEVDSNCFPVEPLVQAFRFVIDQAGPVHLGIFVPDQDGNSFDIEDMV